MHVSPTGNTGGAYMRKQTFTMAAARTEHIGRLFRDLEV